MSVAAKPADKHHARGRHNGCVVCKHLCLRARAVSGGVNRRGARGCAVEIVSNVIADPADPLRVEHDVFINLHARVEERARTVALNQPAAERISGVGFI
ncbi:hypothetical protein SDC9_89606 [bioreactor metagenome]|uniref:Uncharacterized protein n=1 Tax=bioreactor metagenome TaxID=1076179 RepID=A0A644ZZE1_9ZZZZ